MQDLEKNSKEEFDKWAATYDKNSFSYYHFYFTNKRVIKLLNPQNGDFLLDIGFGTGILLKQLVETSRELQLFGLDISEEMYKKAKAKLLNYPHIQLALGSANKMPYQDNYFDFVTCIHSLHHHPNTLQSLIEISRVLKPGGKAVIVDVSLDGPFRRMLSNWENKNNREGKVYRYTKSEMESLIKQAGFKNIKQQYIFHISLATIGE